MLVFYFKSPAKQHLSGIRPSPAQVVTCSMRVALPTRDIASRVYGLATRLAGGPALLGVLCYLPHLTLPATDLRIETVRAVPAATP